MTARKEKYQLNLTESERDALELFLMRNLTASTPNELAEVLWRLMPENVIVRSPK